MSAKKTAKKRAARTPKTSATPKSDAPKRGAKTAFILGYGLDVPSRQIVEEGAKRGLVFSQTYVSAIRTAAKKRQAKGTATTAAKKRGRPAKVQAATARVKRGRKPNASRADGDEQSFFSLVLRLGTAKVEEMLERVKAMRV